MLKVKMIVSGHVQGVGFRYFVIMEARKLGIFGRVWNNADGSVGIFAQAPDSQTLAAFTANIRKGPIRSPFAKVSYLNSVPANFPDYKDFNITYDPF